jgi:hypothetical protein
MEGSVRRSVLAVVATGLVAGIAVCAYQIGSTRYEYDAAEAALRRGLSFASHDRTRLDSTISLLPDSLAHDTTTLQRFYQLEFVDAFPYNATSGWNFFMHPAYVWRICFDGGTVYEAEVRPSGHRQWTVWLTRLPGSSCEGHSKGGA